MRTALLLITLLFFFTNKLNSQEVEKGYVIYSFEINRHQGSHGNFLYHWIVPIDSIKFNTEFKIYPVYLDESFFISDFNNCCSNKGTDLLTFTNEKKIESSNNSYFFVKEIETLRLIISKNKKYVQTITKKWTNGKKEDVKIWATPIIGQFCSCELIGYSIIHINYHGIIFLPKANFKTFEEFWKLDKSKDVLFTDYSRFAYLNYLQID